MALTNLQRAGVELLVSRGRALRGILDELRAEAQRLKDADEARWKEHEPRMKALRENPCEATARAYLESLDWVNSKKTYDQRADIDRRRSQVIDELCGVHKELHALVGIGLSASD